MIDVNVEDADLSFGSHAAAAIDPDVFGHDGALLVELQVFLELCEFISTVTLDRLMGDSITPLALETTVDSACILSQPAALAGIRK